MVFSLDVGGLSIRKPIRILSKMGRRYAMARERLNIRRGDDVVEIYSSYDGDRCSSEGLGTIAEEDVDLTGAGSDDRLGMGRDTAEGEHIPVDGESSVVGGSSLVLGDDHRIVLSDGDLPTARNFRDARDNGLFAQESGLQESSSLSEDSSSLSEESSSLSEESSSADSYNRAKLRRRRASV